MSTRRMVGYGLLAGAAGVTLLMLLWLAVSGAQGGGVVLGLMLLLVLAGPLGGAGWFVLQQARTEAVEERQFLGKRRVLEADRLFRRQMAADLRDLAQKPGLPSARITQMADALQRTDPDPAAWYSVVQLDDSQVDVLRQYDDLVRQRVRRLRDRPAGELDVSSEAVQDLQQALDQRSDLLLHGRQAATISPDQILRAPAPTSSTAGVQQIDLGDAVSHEGEDYVVEGVQQSFSEGQTWRLAHLEPAAEGVHNRWLYVAPGGLEVALLAEVPAPQTGAPQWTVGADTLPLVGLRTSTVRVRSKAGSAEGVLVTSWQYRSGTALGLVEQWPDGAVRAYEGRTIRSSDLTIWPAARELTPPPA